MSELEPFERAKPIKRSPSWAPQWAYEKYGHEMIGIEERPVGRTRHGALIRAIPCHGLHADTCQLTDDGWICIHPECSIIDAPSSSELRSTVDGLIAVDRVTERRRWHRIPLPIIDWRLVRRSTQTTFINGRCVLPAGQREVEEIWYADVAITKRGARRRMRKIAPEPSDV